MKPEKENNDKTTKNMKYNNYSGLPVEMQPLKAIK